ncbi:MAG: TonB-dependent receptor [Bacteroidales bacterium]|nr:TonB-dependent receptor [Bacteroidales bacterium]
MRQIKLSYKLLLLLGSMFIVTSALAQERMVTGTLTDSETKEPLIGATVVIQGTTNGASTDLDGNYQIQVSNGDVLYISFVGYLSQTITISGQSVINVELVPDIKQLEEIVVIGYGTVKKEDMTGAVSVVTAKDFNQGAITSPEELLMGKTAGVQITAGGGAPGSESTIRIRGGSSLRANNNPLIVIDGVPLDNDNTSGLSNSLSTINPNDIESFTVLKDASATAIYGSRASNGVIIISTKKGKKGKTAQINYHVKTSLATPVKSIDVLTPDEFTSLVTERYPEDTEMLLGEQTDWMDVIMQNAFAHEHTLSVSGAYKFLPYRASVGYVNQDGTLKTSNFNRTTATLNLTPSFFDDKLQIAVNTNYSRTNSVFADRGAVGTALSFNPTVPVYDQDNPFGGYYSYLSLAGTPVANSPSNPLSMLELRDNHGTVNRFIGNAQVDYKLHFLPDLKLSALVGTDRVNTTGEDITSTDASWERGLGRQSEYTQEKKNELLDLYFTYNKKIDAIKSELTLTGGYSWQHFYRESYSFAWVPESGDTLDYPRTIPTEYYLISFFGRLNYSLAGKYLLTLTLRQDATSRFSENNRKGIFPSVAFAWNIRNESFMESLEAVSELKLRLGYGITGQQDLNINDDYPYYGTYTYSTNSAMYPFGNTMYTTLRPEGYNASLKWEETTTYNAGLDFGLYNNRITGSVEVYRRLTKDLLNELPLASGTNFINAFVQNIGDLENNGVELYLNANALSAKDYNWNISFNASYQKSTITKLTESVDSSYIGILTEGISGGIGNRIQIHSEGFSPNAFYVYEQVYDVNGIPIENLYVDRNGDGVLDADDIYRYMKRAPDLVLGISSSFAYKALTISFSGRANFGNYVYNNYESTNAYFNRVTSGGSYLSNIPESTFNSEFITTPNDDRYKSDFYVRNASFFRMDNITVSYLFSNLIKENTSLSVYATVQNAFVITKYNGIDPEVFSGVDNNVYPRPRTFLLGLNLSL